MFKLTDLFDVSEVLQYYFLLRLKYSITESSYWLGKGETQ